MREIIEQNNGKALVIKADVSQYQQAMGLIQQTVEHFNRLDIMVNNAGMEIHNAFLDVTEEQWDRVLSVDLKGTFFCAQAAARALCPGGVYAVNVADGPPLEHARRAVATVRSVYPESLMIAEPGVIKHTAMDHLIFGMPDGSRSAAAAASSMRSLAASMSWGFR